MPRNFIFWDRYGWKRYGPAASFLKKRLMVSRKEFPWDTAFSNIRYRCLNKKDSKYKSYGARGIKPSISRRQLMTLFYECHAWELRHPSVDRINPLLDYTYENCRWVDMEYNRKARVFSSGPLKAQFEDFLLKIQAHGSGYGWPAWALRRAVLKVAECMGVRKRRRK